MTNEWTLPANPFSGKDKLIIGISGGLDSIGLLFFLLEDFHLPPRNLIAAHVNYGLRGRDSELDEGLIRRICRERNIPFEVLKVSRFRQKVKKNKRSLQEFAREIRFSFFQRLAKKHKAWGVAVAHHLEDQAETVLDRLLRGAGARGLSGLRPVQILKMENPGHTLKVWRPLLHCSKEQIRDFVKSKDIHWREDRSNQKNKYRRNQIRNQILPYLSKWNPKLKEVLAHIGEITGDEDILMEELLKPLGKKLKSRRGKQAYFCDSNRFQQIPKAFQRRWARKTAEELIPETRGISFERIEEIIRLWEGKEKGPRDLGFGLIAGRTSKQAYLKLKG